MRRLLVIGGILFVVASTTTIVYGAINLNSSKSNTYREFPNSKLVSQTVNLTSPGETKTVVTTPATGDFIVTQVCISPVSGGVLLAATGFGPIAHVGSAGSSAASASDSVGTADVPVAGPGGCQTFTPGMYVAKNKAITCSISPSAVEGDYFCTISAVWV